MKSKHREHKRSPYQTKKHKTPSIEANRSTEIIYKGRISSQKGYFAITCVSISQSIPIITLRSLHGIGHFWVTCTVSAHFPATIKLSPGCSIISAVRIASVREGMIQKPSPSRRGIPTLTSRIIERESSV